MVDLKHIKEQVYNKSPIIIQNFLINVEGRRINKRRYGKKFFAVLDKVTARKYFTDEEYDSYLNQKLKQNLIQAYENSEYYRVFFKDIGFDPYKFYHREQLEAIPIQTKETIKNNIDKLRNKNIKNNSYFFAHTSGTTGSGLIFPQSKMCEYEQWATWWRYRLNIGLKFNQLCGYFGGRLIVPLEQTQGPLFRIVKASNQIMFSMYHLNKNTIQHYVDTLNKTKIKWIHGYPSTISNLAALMIENNEKLDHEIDIITIGSENLYGHQLDIIKRAFGVIPFQHYGLAEPVANISQCLNHNLHIDEDYAYVELVPSGLDNKFKIIGTSLTNEAMLFLRYDTNDIVTLAQDQRCTCGYGGRMIESIDGREEDFIILKNGTKLGRLDHIFKDLINIKESQIIQDENGNIGIYVVKNRQFNDEDDNRLRKELAYRFKNDSYKIIYTDFIKKTESGKLRFVISNYKTQ